MNFLPARRLLLLIAVAALLFWIGTAAALVTDLLLLVVAVLDALLARRTEMQVNRSAPRHLALGSRGLVRLRIANRTARAATVRVTDDLPPRLERCDAEGAGPPLEEWTLTIQARDEAEVRYGVSAVERGSALLGSVHLRVLGPLRLVWHQRRDVRSALVRVQPGLLELRRYRLLAHRNRLREMGLRAMRTRGEGSSFESLREYVRGDDPRQLDWKASGKRGSLIVRQMEAERSQNLLLAIDAGRLMTEELADAGGSGVRRERLDSALSAALLLGEVAAQHGDRVGLLVFSDTIELFLPPTRGPLRRLAEPLAEIQARMVEPDYPGAFAFLSRQLRRRSLLVLFTDVIDAHASAALVAHAGAATRRHLPLAIAIRNPALEDAASAPASDEVGVYRRAAAEELLQLRSVALAIMRRAGVLVADTLPGDAVPATINRYLEVKRRGAL